MPIYTKRYQLEAFKRGEPYSAASDKRRFTTIDSQFAFISDLISDGVIDGFDISEADDPGEVIVSSGDALIDRAVTRIFNEKTLSVLSEQDFFVFIKRRLNVQGGFSSWSNIADIQAVDTTAPSSPGNLRVKSLDSNFIEFEWDNNLEADFSHYDIERSLDGTIYESVDSITSTSFIDEGLTENTEYHYRVYSVDLSGNISDFSELSVFTEKDFRPPLPPSSYTLFASSQSISVFWLPPDFDNIDFFGSIANYEISYKKNNEPDSSYISVLAGSNATNYRITGLEDSVTYSVRIKSISVNDIKSDEIVLSETPFFRINSIEVEDIIAGYTVNDNDELVAELSWSLNADEYQEVPSRYQITFLDPDLGESEPITAQSTLSRNVRLIPYQEGDIVNFRRIQELTDYFITISTVDSMGNLSSGTTVSLHRQHSVTFRLQLMPKYLGVEFLHCLLHGKLLLAIIFRKT